MSCIVLLTGSPRRGGNTMKMADAFEEAARSRGHEVKRYDTAMMKIGGCQACEKCYSAGRPCVQDDSFNEMADAIEAADGVVFAAPTYWYSFPAQIKAAMDRMFCFAVGHREIAGKKCALITCCEEEEMSVMDGLIKPLERAAALMKWELVGSVRRPCVYKKGDIDATDGLKEAAALAERF